MGVVEFLNGLIGRFLPPTVKTAPGPVPKARLHLRKWDKGIFALELAKNSIYPRALTPDDNGYICPAPENAADKLAEGTFSGSQKAATEMYRRIELRFSSYFDIANFETAIPQPLKLEHKQDIFTFQVPGSDKYPQHLNLVPNPVQTTINFLEIFNFMRLLDTGLLLGRVIPEKILDWANDDPVSGTMAGIEKRNHVIRAAKKNIGNEPNIGDRWDWYSDAVFAQQFFTGTNPTTISKASGEWLTRFQDEARRQGNAKFLVLTGSAAADSIYIQDYSYFRSYISTSKDSTPVTPMISDDKLRFGCAAVCLFSLDADGKLHPISIIIDYKGSMENSVTIFNKNATVSEATVLEADDWAWRYAKLCVMVSDWTCHELQVHLTDTHFVEEVVIVAAHRTFPVDHPVYRLLKPHWLKTLPLNAAARSALVPSFIVDINGMSIDQTYAFINSAYNDFDWKGQYIPNDLANRGFPRSELFSKKFHNYVYGKNMLMLWDKLREFVAAALKTSYATDSDVASDTAVQAFVNEMRNPLGGRMTKFPDVKTVDDLVDMVVMGIHIASPQHTAINYLQDYYQAFVPNKLGCLMAPLPTTLRDLNAFKEPEMILALPIKHPRVWLMSSHLAWLLSYRVAEDQTLLNYALSLQKLSSIKKGDDSIADAGDKLVKDLMELKIAFQLNSQQMDDQTLPYDVMDPGATAVSILL